MPQLRTEKALNAAVGVGAFVGPVALSLASTRITHSGLPLYDAAAASTALTLAVTKLNVGARAAQGFRTASAHPLLGGDGRSISERLIAWSSMRRGVADVDACAALFSTTRRSHETTSVFEHAIRKHPEHQVAVLELIVKMMHVQIDRRNIGKLGSAAAVLSRFGDVLVGLESARVLCGHFESSLSALPPEYADVVDPLAFVAALIGKPGLYFGHIDVNVGSSGFRQRNNRAQLDYFGGTKMLAVGLERHFRERATHLWVHDLASVLSIYPELAKHSDTKDLADDLYESIRVSATRIDDPVRSHNVVAACDRVRGVRAGFGISRHVSSVLLTEDRASQR